MNLTETETFKLILIWTVTKIFKFGPIGPALICLKGWTET